MSKNNKKPILLLLLLLLIAFLIAFGWNLIKSDDDSTSYDENGVQIESTETSMGDDSNDGHNHEEHAHDAHADKDKSFSPAVDGDVYKLPDSDLIGARGIGNPNAPVTIHEFFSLTCNHCADFHNKVYPELKRKYIDTGKVYFIFEEFPLNGPALYASMTARCLPEERYEGFIDMLFKTQDKWAFSGNFKEALKKNAMLAGMSEEGFNECFNNDDVRKAMAERLQDASQNYGIKSTPSFVINHGEKRMIGGQPIEAFDAVIKDLMMPKASISPVKYANEPVEETEVEAESEEPAETKE